MHNLARPEALAGTVHNTRLGYLDAPIHPSLLNNTELLDLVAISNAVQNSDGNGTYLLSQARSLLRVYCPVEVEIILRYDCRIVPSDFFEPRSTG